MTAVDQDLPPNIMLVEDEVIVALDVQRRLEMFGYRVVAHAASGDDALSHAFSKSLDLILMDIKIRGSQDGIETAQKIRERLDVPIIYLTAFADDETLKRARQTGAYGYLIKPFEDRELRSAIEMALYKYKLETKLRESEERYALAVRATNGGIWDWNIVNQKVYYSPRWANMLGCHPEQIGSQPEEWFDRIHPDDQSHVSQVLNAHLLGDTPVFECEYRIRHQDGGYRWMHCRGLALFNGQHQPYRMAGSQVDITDRKNYQQALEHKALHDELTGLHNRALFTDRLNNVLEQNKRNAAAEAVVLFLDLDNFKVINDSFGHGWGDEILLQIARRLERSLRPGDTVARFGGDEFAILLDQVDDMNAAQQIADRILTQISEPFLIEGKDYFVTASVGLLPVYPAYQSTDEILRDVDIAMYSAKSKGRARYAVFDQDMRAQNLLHLDQVFDIRRALEKHEFVLHYQPIFSLPERQLVGFEALIRWRHPSKGMIFPGEFISVAEETRLIIPIGDWVLRTACTQANAWNKKFGRSLKMAVNVSRYQLLEDNFIANVQDALEVSGLAPHLLELEITESVAMENLELTLLRVEQLRQMEVVFSIDDFGIGYSSMEHLKHFPVKTLKIDRSFINEMEEDDRAIVGAMIKMAHQLKLTTVAEGVETEYQLSTLSELMCDQVQGYYLGKGLPAEDAAQLISRQR